MFFKQKKNGEVTLVIDIGSSSVGAALVLISKEVVPKIFFSTRLHIALQNESEKSRSLTAVTTALESVIKTVAAEHSVIHKTHIFFSSPWYFSETKIIKNEYDSPTLITHHTIDQITKESERKFVENSKSSGEIVEHRIIRTRLNGYDTSNPYNKKAKKVEVTFFASMVAKDVLESVRRIIAKHFRVHRDDVSSFALAAFNSISGILPSERDYLIVDIRGDVTDVSLITDGALIKSVSFPQGKNNLIQNVANNSGQSQSAALSLIKVAFHNDSDPGVKIDVQKNAEKFKQVWLELYAKTLQEITGGGADVILPQTIFLMADSDIDMFFENIGNEIKNNGDIRSLRHLNFRDYVETSSVPTDSFLALESIFVTMI
jgi:cell division ATPase FtsA